MNRETAPHRERDIRAAQAAIAAWDEETYARCGYRAIFSMYAVDRLFATPRAQEGIEEWLLANRWSAPYMVKLRAQAQAARRGRWPMSLYIVACNCALREHRRKGIAR